MSAECAQSVLNLVFLLALVSPSVPKESLGDPVHSGLCDIRRMAPSTRIERVTLPLGGGCSIH